MKRSLLMSTFVVSSATRGGTTLKAYARRRAHRVGRVITSKPCFRKFADRRHVPVGTLAKACLSWARCHRFVLPTRSPSWAELARQALCPVYRRGLMKLQPGRKVFKDPVLCAESRKPPRYTYMAEQKSHHPMLFASVGPSRPHYIFFLSFFFRSTCRLWTGQGWPVNGGVRREDSSVPSVCSYHW